ncbi:MAG: hypothetical protein L0Y32_00800 [Nevskiales bacterium]|nr:hypothetical protein [Nevskiales bacterium]
MNYLPSLRMALLGVLLAGCTPTRGTREAYAPPDTRQTYPVDPGTLGVPAPYGEPGETGRFPRKAEEVSSPVVLALLRQAHGELAAGHAEQATATLERALRIEPRNPFIWQQLADTHLQRHLPDQAESVAQRSNGLSYGNPYIEVENWRLIAAARQARGDQRGAQQAQEKANELHRQLDD